MKRLIIGLAVACGTAFSQGAASKLSGKTVYLLRQFVDGGHANGFNALRTLLETNAQPLGYKLEIAVNPLTQAQLDQVFNRLYKADGLRPASGIDVMIFSQGEGDWNISGNPTIPGAQDRMAKINTHVRNGGGLIITHAAGGREISRAGWTYGAKLMTDWFEDEYFASAANGGNGGHFSSGTQGTITMDEETLQAKDPSTFFIRNLMLQPKAKKGYAMPLVTDQVRGEWYHFNGGYKYEGKAGGTVFSSNNRWQPTEVRGHLGIPDTGIGPAKVIAVLTKIQGANYTPPGKGRHSVWGREVSKGVFDSKASATNGRFAYFNPGHAGDEYTLAGGWVGSLYLSTLRWIVKDDRGCTDSTRSNYNSLATVDDASCTPSGIGRDAVLENAMSGILGRLSVQGSSLTISVQSEGAHSIQVTDVRGRSVFRESGEGSRTHVASSLQRGFYMTHVKVGGQAFRKLVSIQ